MNDRCLFEIGLGISYPPRTREEFEHHFLLFFCLFSLGRRIWSPFSSTISLVLLAQVASAAILFAENCYTKQVFFKDFFPKVEKPSLEISKENELSKLDHWLIQSCLPIVQILRSRIQFLIRPPSIIM